jgi:hypothetical protein
MGIFDAIAAIQKMADDPELTRAAENIGKAALALPDVLASMDASLKKLVGGQETGNDLLREISLGLDAMSDPIKRPPFHAEDVQAAMDGSWPPKNLPEGPAIEPKDCTDFRPVEVPAQIWGDAIKDV